MLQRVILGSAVSHQPVWFPSGRACCLSQVDFAAVVKRKHGLIKQSQELTQLLSAEVNSTSSSGDSRAAIGEISLSRMFSPQTCTIVSSYACTRT